MRWPERSLTSQGGRCAAYERIPGYDVPAPRRADNSGYELPIESDQDLEYAAYERRGYPAEAQDADG
jgi:hypothetical protein